MSEERYYYTCAEHVDSGEIHCIRDAKEFKVREFNNLTSGEYRNMTLKSLNKKHMDRIHKSITPVPGTGLLPSVINAFSLFTASGETGEEILMKHEFKGKRVVFIDSKK